MPTFNCPSFSLVSLCAWSGSRAQCLTSNIFSMLRTVLGLLGFQLLFAEAGMIFISSPYFLVCQIPWFKKKSSHRGLLSASGLWMVFHVCLSRHLSALYLLLSSSDFSMLLFPCFTSAWVSTLGLYPFSGQQMGLLGNQGACKVTRWVAV